MHNPNLAWSIACICCLVQGIIWADMDDFGEAVGTMIVNAIVGIILYSAISYMIQ